MNVFLIFMMLLWMYKNKEVARAEFWELVYKTNKKNPIKLLDFIHWFGWNWTTLYGESVSVSSAGPWLSSEHGWTRPELNTACETADVSLMAGYTAERCFKGALTRITDWLWGWEDKTGVAGRGMQQQNMSWKTRMYSHFSFIFCLRWFEWNVFHNELTRQLSLS